VDTLANDVVQLSLARIDEVCRETGTRVRGIEGLPADD
jgi:hypothetical protein